MKNKLIPALVLGAVASLGSVGAAASVITYETRATNAGVNNSDYFSSWSSQTSAISSQSLSSFTNVVAPGSNHHSHLQVSFDVSGAFAGGDWAFQVAPDAGYGGAMYLDGVLIDVDTSDLWWGFSWGNINELLAATSINVSAASHTLDVFWAEGCCNGGQSARFSMNGGADWQALSVANLDAAAVPEPSSVALLALGLLGLARLRKKSA